MAFKSPQLSSIECLWEELERRDGHKLSKKQELFNILHDEWQKIPFSYLINLMVAGASQQSTSTVC
jgi:hypothetical protein